jgi:hypothetical protein
MTVPHRNRLPNRRRAETREMTIGRELAHNVPLRLHAGESRTPPLRQAVSDHWSGRPTGDQNASRV